MISLKIKAAIAAVVIPAVFGAGWVAKGWLEDSKALTAIRAQEALAVEIRAGQAAIAKQVEDRLGQLRANERIIDRGVIREIQKPIYQRVCFEPELVDLLNQAAKGKLDGKVQ